MIITSIGYNKANSNNNIHSEKDGTKFNLFSKRHTPAPLNKTIKLSLIQVTSLRVKRSNLTIISRLPQSCFLTNDKKFLNVIALPLRIGRTSPLKRGSSEFNFISSLIRLAAIIIFVLTAQLTHAQYNYMVRGDEHTLLGSGSVQLPSPETFRGTVVWQKSLDNTTWANVMNSASADTLDLNTGAPAMYRLALGEGTCDTLYSDTVNLGQVDNLNALLAVGFTIGDLLNNEIPLDSMVADSVPVADLIDAGFSIDTLYKHGISVERLADGGVSIDDLLNTNIPLTDIYEGGFLVGTLEQHGVDSMDLVNAGLIGTVTDYDGNVYKWVKIGDQIWMAENLKVTHWQGGTVIQTTTDPNEDIEGWPANDARRQWAYNGVEDNVDIYGRLYTYYAIEGDSVCPSGWHVPDSLEFNELAKFLGGYDITGGKLKSTSDLWNSPNTGATNESGFNALPSGVRNLYGEFLHKGNIFFHHEANGDEYYYISYDYKSLVKNLSSKLNGFPLRCIKN